MYAIDVGVHGPEEGVGSSEAKVPSGCEWPNVCVRDATCLSRKAGSPPLTHELSHLKMMRQKAVFQVTLVIGMF